MKYLSCAEWPENTIGRNQKVTTDRHDSKEHADAVCKMLDRDGYGGEGKIFPLRTWTEEVNDCTFDGNGTCKALACYSSEQCNSRDEKGSPRYGS